jgi:tripartite-type tricarboxylate transporter receptor subunit TctC
VLIVAEDSPYKTFADFEKKLKAGEEMSYSSAGVGTLLHIATAVMANATGADFDKLTHVPYKGGGKARAAVVGGQVDFSFQNLSAVAGALEAGQLRALVVTMPERQPIIKDVPTAKEVGYTDLEKIIGWSAVYGPPGLPKEVVSKWSETLTSLTKDKAWNRMTKGLGNIVAIKSPEETKSFVEAQYKVFNTTMEKLGLTIK